MPPLQYVPKYFGDVGRIVGAALRGRPRFNLNGRLPGVSQTGGDAVDGCGEGVVQVVVILAATFAP